MTVRTDREDKLKQLEKTIASRVKAHSDWYVHRNPRNPEYRFFWVRKITRIDNEIWGRRKSLGI